MEVQQKLSVKKRLHNLLSRVSFGESVVRILEKIDGIITALHCLMIKDKVNDVFIRCHFSLYMLFSVVYA